jgi:hypothetical protein
MTPHKSSEVERGASGGLLAFLGENKKWWLLPILVMTGLVLLLAVLAGTGGGPFNYALF